MGLESKDPYGNDEMVGDAAGQVGALLLDVDHIGIAVEDLDEAIQDYRETFGVVVDHREVFEDDAVEVAVLQVGGSAIHLLGASGAHSPIGEFVDTYGPGVHHVGYRVADCAVALESMKAAGATPIDQAPRPGSRGTTVAFIHPKGSFGTLIELVQE